MPSAVARLPTALLRDVLAFFTAPSAHRDEWHCHDDQLAELQTIAQVSREWNTAAQAVASERTLSKLWHKSRRTYTGNEATTVPTNRIELLELRRRVTLRGAFLRVFNIAAESEETPQARPLTTDEWRSLLVHAPLLETLDLACVPRAPVRMGCREIVEAAGLHCPRLQTLHLSSEIDDYNDPDDTARLLDTVLRGLAQWASSGGLRRLTLSVPFMRLRDPHHQAARYLNALSASCPNLERLGGYDIVRPSFFDRECDDDMQWFVDEATWETFCLSCTQLTSFHWVVAPFATSFFEIFGRACKPRLDSLTFLTPMKWDWALYRRYLPPLDRGSGVTAIHAHAALRACPALTSLEVQLSLTGGPREDSIHEESSQADELTVNKEIFGDEFCAAVAVHCLQLERFTIGVSTYRTDFHSLTIQSFTDAALRSLATLPRLTCVHLMSVNITGGGLFALVTGAACREARSRPCDYTITLGDGGESGTACYVVFERFLTRLAEWQGETDGMSSASLCDVRLRLRNGCNELVDKCWSEQFFSRVWPLIETVQQRHPTMRVRMNTQEFVTEEDEHHIVEFAVLPASDTVSDGSYDYNEDEVNGMLVDHGEN